MKNKLKKLWNDLKQKFVNSQNKKNAMLYQIILICLVSIAAGAWTSAYIRHIYGESSPNKRIVQTEEMNYNEFLSKLEAGDFSTVELTNSKIIPVEIAEDGTEMEYRVIRMNDDELVNRLNESGVEFHQKRDGYTSYIFSAIMSFLPLIFLFWIYKNMLGKNMGVTEPVAEYNVEEKEKIKFNDVAGEDEAKESLVEIVDILHNPQKYTSVGAKLPKGVLLVGPPGTGKTLLAKAVAGEAGVPFYSMAGSEFVEMFVGLGAKRVRKLFEVAAKNAPCIVFIDEIDAMAQSRARNISSSSESDQTLNQLLSEMDGFDSSKGIVVMAATNRPESLDKALLRPGRFDRQVIVERPDLDGRISILKVHSSKLNLSDDVDLKELALMTTGASGADLANIVNEGAINTARASRNVTTQKDLMDAAETVLTGKEKKTRVLSTEEKNIVAHHEVGHALITAVMKNAEPVQKITIIPRTNGALGYVLQVPEEEKYIYRKGELKSKLVTLLGGQAAEEVFFGETSTGSSNDLERATRLAKSYVAQYGMSELGTFGFMSQENKYLDGNMRLFCGEAMESKIDQYAIELLNEAFKEAKQIILNHKEVAGKIAEYLYKEETITGEEFMKIFRQNQEI